MRTLRVRLMSIATLATHLICAQANTWVQKNDIGTNMIGAPYPRMGACAFSIGSKGYVIGGAFDGNYLQDLWEYDPAANTWTARAPFPGPAREDAVGFSIGSKGYMTTGYNGSHLNDLWEYDPATDSWTAKAPMPTLGRRAAVAFVIGAQAYVTTGRNSGNLNDTWRYDPTTDSWMARANFGGTARSMASAFSVGGLGYVGTGQDGTYRNDLWAYDPVTDTWTMRANLPLVIAQGIGLGVGNKGYIGYGRSLSTGGLYTIANTWYEYDPPGNAWIIRSGFPKRYDGFGFVVNGRAYVGAGSDFAWNNPGGMWVKTFGEFDPVTNMWETKARFGASVTQFAGCSALSGKGYVLQGGMGYSCATDGWEYDPATGSWALLPMSTFSAATTGFGIGTRAYRATGYYNTAYQTSVGYYDAATGQAGSVSSFAGGARINAAAFTIGGKAYMGTGFGTGTNSGRRKDMWEYDPVLNTWTQKAPFGGTGRGKATAFAVGGRGYLGLGSDSTGYRNDFWCYDPLTDAWSARAAFPGGARAGASSFVIGTRAYVFGGVDITGAELNDLWAYDPVTDSWSAKASLPGAPREGASSFAIDGTGYISAGAGPDDGTYPSWLKDTWAYTGEAVTLRIAPKVFLEGAYVQAEAAMRDDLRAGALIPLVEPYTAAGHIVSVAPNTSTTGAVLAVTGTNAIVDHVLVELRDPNSPANVLASKAALIQRDGDVVAMDGISPVSFLGSTGNYRVAVRHRNHLAVMTAAAVALSPATTAVDFTNPATMTYGTNTQKQIGPKMVMWAGDATGNGQIRYTGSGNDRDPILLAVGSTTPNATVTNVYDRRDTNLDGVIKYTGSANDRDIILTNVGSTTPNNTRTQQLP